MTTEELIVTAVETPSLVLNAQPEVKAVKATKPKKARNPSAHPPYIDMITEAIVTLKEKNGSSQYAISKHIEDKHKQLSSNFKKMLLVQLKRLVASGKLVKVKGSFKLPAAPSAKKSVKPVEKKKAPVKTKAASTKPKLTAKSAPKSKVVAVKPKQASKAKPKASKANPTVKAKVSAVKPKATVNPSKVARTSTRTSPGKRTAAALKPAPKKAPAKPKTVKSPVKKTVSRRGKK